MNDVIPVPMATAIAIAAAALSGLLTWYCASVVWNRRIRVVRLRHADFLRRKLRELSQRPRITPVLDTSQHYHRPRVSRPASRPRPRVVERNGNVEVTVLNDVDDRPASGDYQRDRDFRRNDQGEN